jgi:hypothetical protein
MKILIGVLITLCLLVCIHQAHAETTTINQKGMPVPSAMAPSMSAFSQDVCAVPISAAGNLGFISLSGGTVLLDENCVKIKLAKTLNDLGLKVAAVSVLCQDPKVWDAMEMSGSPCPMGGAVGFTAKKAWYEKDPEKFRKLYGPNYTLPTPSTTNMLGTVISNLIAKVTSFLDLCLAVVSHLKKHCNNIIVGGIDQVILIVQYIKSQLVALKWNIELCLAQLTRAVLLMKLGLMNVLHKIGQVGQQLLITVRQILQRVLNLLKRGR